MRRGASGFLVGALLASFAACDQVTEPEPQDLVGPWQIRQYDGQSLPVRLTGQGSPGGFCATGFAERHLVGGELDLQADGSFTWHIDLLWVCPQTEEEIPDTRTRFEAEWELHGSELTLWWQGSVRVGSVGTASRTQLELPQMAFLPAGLVTLRRW